MAGYPYGTQGGPAPGCALPGLPRRADQRGEILFALPGTYLWTVPEGVFSVCVLAIGGGGGASAGNDINSTTYNIYMGGGGGATAWDNNLPVTPGEVITIVVGAAGGVSYFRDTSTVAAGPGATANISTYYGGLTVVPAAGGVVLAGQGYSGGVGGAGRATTTAAATGGTAGGYAAIGAAGIASAGSQNGNAGAGGSGGSGGVQGSGSLFGYGSGGIGPYGLGTSAPASSTSGIGGSGGENGNPAASGRFGAGASIGSNLVAVASSPGCVRVVWGDGRAFPSTDIGYN